MRFMNYKAKGVSDLTLFAKRYGGTFQFQKVYETINGTTEVDLDGPRDIPISGKDYLRHACDAYRDENYMMGRFDPEVYTRTRILALTDYVNRLQIKQARGERTVARIAGDPTARSASRMAGTSPMMDG